MVSVLQKLAEEPAGYPAGRNDLPLPESALAKLWQKRAARQEWFRTSKGRRVRVLYPGRPGKTAGPDFRDAVLEFEDLGLVQGDVEIHLRQQDWYSHGHSTDPNYNGVVLHAALDLSAGPTNLRSGGESPVVSLKPLLAAEDPPEELTSASIWRVLEPLGYGRPISAAEMVALLEAAGDARFTAKSRRFQKFLHEQDSEQSFYEGLLESLGYRQNQQPFLQLAYRTPYKSLLEAASELTPDNRVQVFESWFLKLAGLLSEQETAGVDLPRGVFGVPMSGREWHCFRVRPANHPKRRIGGAARLVTRFLDEGLLSRLRQLADEGIPKKLIAGLTVAEDGVTYIGAARAGEMAVNVVLPFLHALGDMQNDAGRYLTLYRRFTKLPDNEITREMTGQIIDPSWGKLITSARRQQGLIHLQRLLTGAAS